MDKFVLWAVQFYPFTLLFVLCAWRKRICDHAPPSSDVSQKGKFWNERYMEMGHVLLLNVLFIEKYQSGLIETVYELTYTLPSISNIDPEK